MQQFGLIGFPLSHSFSKRYFTEKFQQLDLSDHHYELFELTHIEEFPALLQKQPALRGLNVTIPYKQQVIPFLDTLSREAQRIGAVNTIAFTPEGKTIGHNTDYVGFKTALEGFLDGKIPQKALVLGTGGAAQAVRVALTDLNIPFVFASRAGERRLHEVPVYSYEALSLEDYDLIINTTPLGMSPKTATAPSIPYEDLSPRHFLFDLVYNPEKTLFLQKGEAQGAKICNGLSMLYGQAEAAWEIWNQS